MNGWHILFFLVDLWSAKFRSGVYVTAWSSTGHIMDSTHR